MIIVYRDEIRLRLNTKFGFSLYDQVKQIAGVGLVMIDYADDYYKNDHYDLSEMITKSESCKRGFIESSITRRRHFIFQCTPLIRLILGTARCDGIISE
jgi:hypothetical protein